MSIERWGPPGAGCPIRAMVSAAVLLVCLTGCPPQGGTGTTQPSRPRPFTLLPPREPSPPDPRTVWPPHAVWAVRHCYRSEDEIAALMESARNSGFNTVLFQVRGAGTVYYRSRIEPLAYEYGGDPGFDPLTVACREAHRRGLALHAWVNVMPGWSGDTPPTDSRQLYNAHPDWFWYDQRGKRQPLGWYVSVNPCLTQVRAYLVGLTEELIRRYPVDGLHLDYIRFPMDESPKGSDYPYDTQTLALYRKEGGKRPQDNRAHWTQWRTYNVTRLVWEIRSMALRTRPGLKLTAACGHDPAEWRRSSFQDGPAWVRGNLVDLVFVMNYSDDTRVFRRRQETWRREAGGRVAAGIGSYLHRDDRTTNEQIRLAAQWGQGFGIFSASSIFSPDARSRQRLSAIRPTLLSVQRGVLTKGDGESLPGMEETDVCLHGPEGGAQDRDMKGDLVVLY